MKVIKTWSESESEVKTHAFIRIYGFHGIREKETRY